MSGLVARLAAIGCWLRWLRPMRPAQLAGQLRHALGSGGVRPVSLPGSPPELAVQSPSVPFLPAPRHAACRGDAREDLWIRLIAREVSFRGGVDWDFDGEGPLFAYQLHQFEYARDESLAPAARLALVRDWIENHPAGDGWDPHPTAHRIFAWGKMLLTPGALALDDESSTILRRSLASQVETLSQHLEVRLQANHLFTNLAAVVFGGLLFEGREADSWLARADAFRGELRDQIHPDGAHEERSPMYHSLILEQVLDLLNVARARPGRAPAGLEDDLQDAAGRMCGALEVWTHPDGEIALFGDSALDIASSPGRLADYATRLGVPVQGPEHRGHLDRGGYVRLADDRWHVIASVAGPSPPHQPGHAHCDALGFELSFDGERIVTDTGVFEYQPGRDRQVSRSTRSHATVEVGGREQAEIWAPHRVGGRPIVRFVDLEPGTAFEATCQSWSSLNVSHHRRVELADGGLHVHDRIDGPGTRVRFALPLAPGLDARLTGAPGTPRQLRVHARSQLQVDLPGGSAVDWRLEASDYFPSFGRRERRWCLVGESASFEAGVWRFRVAAS